jgi:hypothetical protein
LVTQIYLCKIHGTNILNFPFSFGWEFFDILSRNVAWRQWLMPVILAIKEAGIRRNMVQSQPKAFVRPYLKKRNKEKKKPQRTGWWSGSKKKK